jgi:hypothetical protein
LGSEVLKNRIRVGRSVVTKVNMLAFLRKGTVGQLEMGLSREETIRRLGSPPDWLGKPPCFGPSVLTPSQADAWFYYNSAAGIRFGETGTSDSVYVIPEKVHAGNYPFEDWPAAVPLRLGDLREYLIKHKVDFQEDPEDKSGWILTSSYCYAMSVPYEHGRLLPSWKRKIKMICFVSWVYDIPEYIRECVDS